MDLTGRLPYQSSCGDNYMMVAYHYDANDILIDPLKNCQAETIIDAWTSINSTLAAAGTQPNTYFLDNEYSADLKAVFGKTKSLSNKFRLHAIVPIRQNVPSR